MRAVRYNRAYTINVGIARAHWSTPSQSGWISVETARATVATAFGQIDRRQLSGFVTHTSLSRCHYAIRRIARRMPVSRWTVVVCCSLLEWSRLSTSIQAGRATRRSARTSSTTRAGRAQTLGRWCLLHCVPRAVSHAVLPCRYAPAREGLLDRQPTPLRHDCTSTALASSGLKLLEDANLSFDLQLNPQSCTCRLHRCYFSTAVYTPRPALRAVCRVPPRHAAEMKARPIPSLAVPIAFHTRTCACLRARACTAVLSHRRDDA
jgi:hypothetical protein